MFVCLFVCLYICFFCFNHCRIPKGSFTQNFVKIRLDLAEILKISKLDWRDGEGEGMGRREGILLCNLCYWVFFNVFKSLDFQFQYFYTFCFFRCSKFLRFIKMFCKKSIFSSFFRLSFRFFIGFVQGFIGCFFKCLQVFQAHQVFRGFLVIFFSTSFSRSLF